MEKEMDTRVDGDTHSRQPRTAASNDVTRAATAFDLIRRIVEMIDAPVHYTGSHANAYAEGCESQAAFIAEKIRALRCIRPSELSGDELWNHNGEYVSLHDVLRCIDPDHRHPDEVRTVLEQAVAKAREAGCANAAPTCADGEP